VKSDAPLYKLSKKCISAFISHAKRANKSCSFMLRADRRKEESSWDRKNHAKMEREREKRASGRHADEDEKSCQRRRVTKNVFLSVCLRKSGCTIIMLACEYLMLSSC
jgi:hypothetical protein